MKFDLVRPCAKCPFRSDIHPYLSEGRAREIARALLSDKTFSCHETNNYDGDEAVETPKSQHCAGALIILERQDKPNQMMRWMERIRDGKGNLYYDRTKLDMTSPVFPNFAAFVGAQRPQRLLPKPKEITAIVQTIRRNHAP